MLLAKDSRPSYHHRPDPQQIRINLHPSASRNQDPCEIQHVTASQLIGLDNLLRFASLESNEPSERLLKPLRDLANQSELHTAYPLLLEVQEQRRSGLVTNRGVSANDL
jgi:hypothetical protein